MRRAAGRVLLLLVVGAPASGLAQQPPVAPPSAAPPRKAPPPPLFPRHRRGLYRNAAGIEVIDATPQSPPLDTDDPGVPDKGAYEINFTTQGDYAKGAQRVDVLLVDANYGIVPVIAGYRLPSQIKIECPFSASREDGRPFTAGVGSAKAGLKMNFYRDDHRGIAVSIYPQVEFSATGQHAVQKGLAEAGQSVILPLLVAREFRAFSFVFLGGVETPVHAPDRRAVAQLGAGFGRALTRKVAGMIELRSDSNLHFAGDRLVFVNGGLIHGVRNLVVYANVGHSLYADDGLSHTYAGVGMKLLIEPPSSRSSR